MNIAYVENCGYINRTIFRVGNLYIAGCFKGSKEDFVRVTKKKDKAINIVLIA